MSNMGKVYTATLVGGTVGALLAIGAGYPPQRVLLSGIVGAVVMFMVLIALKFRP